MINDNQNDNKEAKDAVAAENAKDLKEVKDTSAVESSAKDDAVAESKGTSDVIETAAAESNKEEPKEVKEAAAAEDVKDLKEAKDVPIAGSTDNMQKVEDVKNDSGVSNIKKKSIASVFESVVNNAQNVKEPVAEPESVNSDAQVVDDVKDAKSADVKNIRERIIVAVVLLAGAWSVFFAVFGKTPPNVVSLKNSASEIVEKTGAGDKTKKVPSKKYKKAKDFTLTDIDGKIVKLSSLKGKTVFIDFWASWCPPCKMSIPAVKKLHEKMKNNPNVIVLSINCWEEKKKAVNFVKKEKITYPVLFSDGVVEKDYNVSSIPRFFIIDGDGNIINEYSGWHPSYAANWENDINEAFSTQQGETAVKQQQHPLSDLDGNAVNIANYKGKTLFLAFWVMQSYACVKAQPAFNAMHNKISKTANAEFISVNTDSQQSLLKTFIKDNNMKYPVLRATQSFADSYGVSSISPACVIIDKTGKPVKTFFGYSDGDEKEWAQAFNEIVKAK